MLLHGFVFVASKYEHVTPLVQDLRWLRVPEHIEYQITVLVYRCLSGLAPAYLSAKPQSVKGLPPRQWLRSWSSDTNRRDIVAVYCRWACLSSRCYTGLKCSAHGLCLINLSASFQATAQDWTFCHGALQKQLHLRVIASCDCVNSPFDIVKCSCSILVYAT